MNYVPGLEGVVVGETAISHVEGDIGRLSYRGRVIEDVVGMDYLEVAYLLLFGHEPDAAKLAEFSEYLARHGRLSRSELKLIEQMPASVHPMMALQAMIPLLTPDDSPFGDHGLEVAAGLQIIARYPALLAAIRAQRSSLANPEQYDPTADYLDRFLLMFTGRLPAQRHCEIFRVVQQLQMEHSFNAGTFTSRVVGSTLASVPAVLSGAVGALSGRLHGGADEAALRVAREIGSPAAAAAYIDRLLAEKGRLMGMGHREYKTVDPRSLILKPLAAELCMNSPLENDYLTLLAIEEVFNRRMAEKGKDVWANVEYYKGVVLAALGVPVPYFTTLFAMARSVGWLAHLIEARRNNKIIRPAASYVGVAVGAA